ncbi:hypothetical protein [Ornithinimicrobium faecis]|uniref:hypothetical protein n=1 Tax=Ornithinimicrobium faecis TaxID=2934158 RepID=UPI00211938B2|nr:hypothetical protein [Ornithinimicrobium sp. HY1745]
MTAPRDRTVHAILSDRTEIVRYDRAGKWYAEPADPQSRRRLITITEAVRLTVAEGIWWGVDQPGGLSFDAKVRRALNEKK